MIKKLFLLSTVFIIISSPIFGQTTESSDVESVHGEKMEQIIPPTDLLTLPVFGEDHAYSVTLRGNGEAVVNMRVALSNFEEQPKKGLTLSFSGETPSEVAVYQIIKEKRCVRYDTREKDVYIEQGLSYDEKNITCLQYEEPNYYNYWWNNTKYYKADVKVEGKYILISLPKMIKEGKAGSYVLFMRAPGYIKKVFGGAYEYHFETLKTDSPIRNINIGISTDSEMKFKGAESQVYYQEGLANQSMMTAAIAKRQSFQSSEFDNYIGQIGQGQIFKSTSNLSPGDTYSLSGLYAKSTVSLYLKEAVIILLAIISVFVVVVSIIYYILKRKDNFPDKTKQPYSLPKTAVFAATASFVCSLGAAGYTLMLIWVSGLMQNWSYYGFNMIGMLFLSIFSFGVYSVIIFGPAVFAGIKRGLWWGVGVFSMTVIWMIIMVVIIGIYYFITQQTVGVSYPDFPVSVTREDMSTPPQIDIVSPAVEQ